MLQACFFDRNGLTHTWRLGLQGVLSLHIVRLKQSTWRFLGLQTFQDESWHPEIKKACDISLLLLRNGKQLRIRLLTLDPLETRQRIHRMTCSKVKVDILLRVSMSPDGRGWARLAALGTHFYYSSSTHNRPNIFSSPNLENLPRSWRYEDDKIRWEWRRRSISYILPPLYDWWNPNYW